MKKNSKNLKIAIHYFGVIAASAMLIVGSACTRSSEQPQEATMVADADGQNTSLEANKVQSTDAQSWINRLNNRGNSDYQFVKHIPLGEAILKPIVSDSTLLIKFYFGTTKDNQNTLFAIFAKGVEQVGRYTIDTTVVFHFNGKGWEPCSFALLSDCARAWREKTKQNDFGVNSFLVPRLDVLAIRQPGHEVFLELGENDSNELKMMLNLVPTTANGTQLRGDSDYLDALCPCPPVCAGNEP